MEQQKKQMQVRDKCREIATRFQKSMLCALANNGFCIAVIGCDGIRSRVRQMILGKDSLASTARFSHKAAFRGLIGMAQAREVLQHDRTSTRIMYLGQDAHVLTFPVAGGSFLNVVAFITDPDEWPENGKLSISVDKADAIRAFSAFGPVVRAIMKLLPDQLDKWAVFDMYDHPAPTYVRSRICIAGDAAHASAPHHGAGAGIGIEDAAVLAALITASATSIQESNKTKAEILRVAFATYNSIRLERSQWVVESSRILGQLYEWQDPHAGSDPKKCAEEVRWRSHKIWDYDVESMIREAEKEYRRRLE
jgi:salicylate hydroxylase